MRVGQPEHADDPGQRVGPLMQRSRRRCGLLDQGRILLRHLVHVAHRQVDLLDTGALLDAGRRNFSHDVGNSTDTINYFAHRHAGLINQQAPGIDLADRGADQLLDFPGCRRAAVGQIAHLGGDDGETTPLLAGTRRFDRRVQGQDIGLEGNSIDHANNIHDLTRRGVNFIHRANHLGHHRAAALRHFRRPHRQLIAWRALSAFCLTVEVNSSIDDAVSSSELACCSVRDDKSRLPAAIWLDALAMLSVAPRTSKTNSTRPSFMLFSACNRRPVSSCESTTIWLRKSLPATATAMSTARPSGSTMPRVSHHEQAPPASSTSTPRPIMN